MTIIEGILIILIVALIAIVIYWYAKGASGPVSLRHPVESRVDEYLDRRFEMMIDEWALRDKAQVTAFRTVKDPVLAGEEARINALKTFREQMTDNLTRLEDRLNALENQTGKK
jgi:hypothetical protein